MFAYSAPFLRFQQITEARRGGHASPAPPLLETEDDKMKRRRSILLLTAVLCLCLLAGCGGKSAQRESAPNEAVPSENTPSPTAAPKASYDSHQGNDDVNTVLSAADAAEQETGSATIQDQPAAKEQPKDESAGGDSGDGGSIDGIRPEFKELMDSYEAFFAEYAEFMKTFNNSSDTTSMLADYMRLLARYTETMEDLNEIELDSLSTAESLYYAEVMTRISANLTDAAT